MDLVDRDEVHLVLRDEGNDVCFGVLLLKLLIVHHEIAVLLGALLPGRLPGLGDHLAVRKGIQDLLGPSPNNRVRTADHRELRSDDSRRENRAQRLAGPHSRPVSEPASIADAYGYSALH